MNKETKKLGKKVGKKLYKVSEDLRRLFEDLDMDEEFEDDDNETLVFVDRVTSLVNIAFDIYPFEVK